MRLHKLPQSYFEAIGRIEFIQSNWYLEGRRRVLMAQITDTLSHLAPIMFDLTDTHTGVCEIISGMLQGLDTMYQSVPVNDPKFDKLVDQFLNHLRLLRESIGLPSVDGNLLEED